MKKILSFLFFVCFLMNLNAQIRLDVEGDGTISGNLGIGTTTPSQLLTISEDNAPTFRMERSGVSRFDFEMYMNSADLRFRGGADGTGETLTDFVTFAGTGNVGIGTISPQAKLDVNGALIAGALSINGGELADDTRINFRASDNSNRFQIETDLDPFLDNDLLGFRSFLEDNILVLKGNGNVGIGTTNPAEKLHVQGNVTIPEGRLFLNRGVRNVHIGKNVGSSIIGIESVIIGENANNANTGQAAHVYIGYNAGTNSTSGEQNVGVGLKVSTGTTTGIANVHVGGFTGSGANGSFQTFVGYNINSLAGEITNENSFAIGSNLTVTSANSGVLGNASLTKVGGSVNWSSVSDQRFKRKIKENVNGLDFIMALRPVTYQVDVEKLHNFTSNSHASTRSKPDASAVKVVNMPPNLKKALAEKSKITYTGFLAQEVEAAAKKIGYDFSGVVKPSNKHDPYGLRYAEFTVPLVKAVQEQQVEIEAKDDLIQIQNEKIENLENRLAKIEALLNGKTTALNTTNKTLTSVRLQQNAPNPFTEATNINYFIPEGTKSASLQVLDQNGHIIKTIPIQATGNGHITLQANLLSAGTYSYSLILDGQVIETKQMVLTH